MTSCQQPPSAPHHERSTVERLALRGIRLLGAATVLGVASAAAWFVWLGWDDVPYSRVQVVGCGATVTVAAVVAYLRVRGIGAVLLLPVAAAVGFAVPWTREAVASDDSGLWLVGLVFLLVGILGGLLLVLGVTALVTTPPAPDRRSAR
jgi:hypothetical protein